MDVMAPSLPNSILDMATAAILSRGVRVFQGAHLAPTEAGHVSALLRLMAPPTGSLIADIGCGIGEVARLMKQDQQERATIIVGPTVLRANSGRYARHSDG